MTPNCDFINAFALLKGTLCKISIFYGQVNGTTFSRHVSAFDIASAGHSTVTVGCTIAYMRLIQLPGVYNDDHGSHNDVHWSHNDVCASIKLFSLNLCLIWLWIFKGCFVDLGNWFQLTIITNQRLNWIIISFISMISF